MKTQYLHHPAQVVLKLCTWGLTIGGGLLGSLGQITSAQAASDPVVLAEPTGIINVSFETGATPAASTLVGPAGGSGQVWNQVTTFMGTGLLDSAGVATTIGWGQTNLETLVNWADPFPPLTLLTSGLRNSDTAANNFQAFVITGLAPSSYYNVWIASANPSAAKSKGTWTMGNPTTSTSNQVVDNTLTQPLSTWVAGNNYVLFEKVRVGQDGTINIDGVSSHDLPTDDYCLPVNGFQLIPTTAPLTDYDTWAGTYLPDNIGLATADFDGDGLKNEMEYIFGLNPTSSSSVNPISVPFDKTTRTLTYTRRTRVLTQLIYNVVTSSDLINWARDREAVQSVSAPVNGVETVMVTVSSSLMTAGKRFIKIVATDNPFE